MGMCPRFETGFNFAGIPFRTVHFIRLLLLVLILVKI
jgi:hypothetical protein